MFIDKIKEKVNSVGYHKVACALLAKEGSDYGNPSELNLVTIAKVLGTKLAMIHREKKYLKEGAEQLKELKEGV